MNYRSLPYDNGLAERFHYYCYWLSRCAPYYTARKYSNMDRSLFAMVARLRVHYILGD